MERSDSICKISYYVENLRNTLCSVSSAVEVMGKTFLIRLIQLKLNNFNESFFSLLKKNPKTLFIETEYFIGQRIICSGRTLLIKILQI